jgi:hypothetical protein
LKAKLTDESAPFVAIELAAILVTIGNDADAADMLRQQIESDDLLLAHQAIENVLYMPDRAPAFKDSILVAKEKTPDLKGASHIVYPKAMSIDMYLYLYGDTPLYYPPDLNFITADERQLDWNPSVMAR